MKEKPKTTRYHRIKDSILDAFPTTGKQRSPLRYPGGKTRAVPAILALIPASENLFLSPFVGGGSVEIAICESGRSVQAHDVFQPLVNFWTSILQDAESLANRIQQYHPLGDERFYDLQKTSFTDPLEDAAAFFVLNRSSFSGSTLSGGVSPGQPRFNQAAIERVRRFECPNLSVGFCDFKDSIPNANDRFLYLDPPYLIKSELYGKRGDTHRGFDHEALAKLLTGRGRWVLSYNNCQEINELYRDYRIIEPQWTYGMGNQRESREVLILSNDLPDLS